MKDWVVCGNYAAAVPVAPLVAGTFYNIAPLVDAGHGFDSFGTGTEDVHEFQANESLRVLRIVGRVSWRSDFEGAGGDLPRTFAIHERISLGIQDLQLGTYAFPNDAAFGAPAAEAQAGSEEHFLWERLHWMTAFDGDFNYEPAHNSSPFYFDIDLKRSMRMRRGQSLMYRVAMLFGGVDDNTRVVCYPMLRTLLSK